MRAITCFVATSLLGLSAAAIAQTTYSNQYPGSYQNNQSQDDQRDNDYQGQQGNDYGRRGDRGQTIVCESSNSRYNRCRLPWRGNARLVQQLSNNACERGRTWGNRGDSVWVDQGCRGRFGPVGGGGWQPGPGWNQRFNVTCGSPQHKYAFCQVDVGRRGHVSLRRQTSNASCVEGSTWGWNRAGVWVNRGCSAVFTVDRRG